MSYRHLLCSLWCLSTVTGLVCAGTVSTDGSVGPRQVLSGPNFTVPETLGSRNGNNLFHSFARFTIDRGESATFTGSPAIQNVISRVTGGEPSTINGSFRSTVGNANVYFVNPAGVVFGPGASIDVPAAFHVSTADEIKLRDGSRFSATDPNASRLSKAAPAAFGFLAANRTNNGLLKVQTSLLVFKPGQRVDLVGRRVEIQNSAIGALGGEFRVVAAGSNQNVSLIPKQGALPLPRRAATDRNADISMEDSTFLALGNGSGRAALSGNDVKLARSIVTVINAGSRNARTAVNSIDVRANSLSVNGTTVSTHARSGSTGDAGTVDVQVAGVATIRNGGGISSSTFSSGNAGNVVVRADKLLAQGTTDVPVTGIFSQANPGSTGRGGQVSVDVTGLAEIRDGAQLSSSTFGTGNAQRLDLHAGQLRITGFVPRQKGGDLVAGIFSQANPESTGGRAGRVSVVVDGLAEVLNGGKISSATFGPAGGDAGGVQLRAGQLRVSGGPASLQPEIRSAAIRSDDGELPRGSAGRVDITVAGLTTIESGGRITSSTAGSGNAGGVRLRTSTLQITGSKSDNIAGIFSEAEAGSTGNKVGTVDITVLGAAHISRGGQVSTSTAGTGPAGNVTLRANDLVLDRASVRSAATNQSNGLTGSVDLQVNDTLTLTDGATVSVQNDAGARIGNAITPGRINIDARAINLNNSRITSASSGRFAAADIVINFRDQLLLNLASITTEAVDGNGGRITLAGTNGFTFLRDAALTTSVTGLQNGNGGDINIATKALILDGGSVQANTSAPRASAGDIDLTKVQAIIPAGNQLLVQGTTPSGFTPGGDNRISATAPDGVDGTIQASTPQLNLSGVLANFGSPQFDNKQLMQDYCNLGQGSTLTRLGNGALPPRKGTLQRM